MTESPNQILHRVFGFVEATLVDEGVREQRRDAIRSELKTLAHPASANTMRNAAATATPITHLGFLIRLLLLGWTHACAGQAAVARR